MRRSERLYHRWSREIRRSGVFAAGERVGVAVSGGPDSVLLLSFMDQFAAESGVCLSVAHFNHQLRGRASDEDERFVKRLAAAMNLPFFRASADTHRSAQERRKNLEAAARDLRYGFFFSLIREGKLDKVATAHTANDQAETVLLRLFRGAGTRGLAGIFPALDGKVVRPFLGVTRPEAEAEIKRLSLEFRVDASNFEMRFARNKIRRDLLPLIEREYNPGIIRILNQFAERTRDDDAYLEQQASAAAQPWRVREGEEERIPCESLGRFHPAIQRRILRQMIAGINPKAALTAAHLEELLRFAKTAQSGKTVELPGGVQARQRFGWLAISRQTPHGTIEYSIPFSPPAEISVPGNSGCRLKVYYENAENPGREPLKRSYNSNEAAFLDAAKCRGSLVIRNWRHGDQFRPAGESKPMKLKEMFTSRRIPREQRQSWPVITDDNALIWVRGLPPASALTPTASTVQFLVIEEIPVRRPGPRPD